MNITGTLINYFAICKRKMWLSAHKITCEQDSDLVKIGKIYHRESDKETIEIDNVKMDGLRDGKVFELKKSKKGSEGARMQVLYYLHVLKKHGIETSGSHKIQREQPLGKRRVERRFRKGAAQNLLGNPRHFKPSKAA